MKQIGDGTGNNDDEKMSEFEREVAMLDKFRCDFIVHFYGAVFIKNKTCLVTEFAEYGSMNDLMKSRNWEKARLE